MRTCRRLPPSASLMSCPPTGSPQSIPTFFLGGGGGGGGAIPKPIVEQEKQTLSLPDVCMKNLSLFLLEALFEWTSRVRFDTVSIDTRRARTLTGGDRGRGTLSRPNPLCAHLVCLPITYVPPNWGEQTIAERERGIFTTANTGTVCLESSCPVMTATRSISAVLGRSKEFLNASLITYDRGVKD